MKSLDYKYKCLNKDIKIQLFDILKKIEHLFCDKLIFVDSEYYDNPLSTIIAFVIFNNFN